MGENTVLTVQQVAEQLQVSLPWLYKKAKNKQIPHLRMGGMLRFRQEDIDKWLDSLGSETKASVERKS